MGKKEGKIETKLREAVEGLGGKLYKMRSQSVDGWPDRLAIVPHKHPAVASHMALIEAKTPEGKLEPSQVVLHRELADLGVTVLMIDSEELIEEYVVFLRESGYGRVKVAAPPEPSTILLPKGYKVQ